MKKTALMICLTLFCSTALFASYDEALKLYQEGRYRESLAMLGNDLVTAKDMEPGSPNYNIRFLAAHNHWKLGNDESAVAHFKKCMQIRKDTVDPYIDLSLMLIERNKLNEADTYAKQGINISRNAMLYFALGRSAMRRKDYWRAKEVLEVANSLDPELYVSYNELGMALMNLKKYGDANTAFSAALAIKGDSPEIISNMGMSLEKMQQYGEALAFYEKAATLQSNSAIQENIQRVKKLIK